VKLVFTSPFGGEILGSSPSPAVRSEAEIPNGCEGYKTKKI
jgi:hypothetical protein